jgi:hypothetical protein
VGHAVLTCKHHPQLRWSTKNIAPIGARSIFFDGDVTSNGERYRYVPNGDGTERIEWIEECACPITDLVVLK